MTHSLCPWTNERAVCSVTNNRLNSSLSSEQLDHNLDLTEDLKMTHSTNFSREVD